MNNCCKMKMKRYLSILYIAIVAIFTQCDTLKGIPTNTSGGLFSLNGTWQLSTSTDNNALIGTTIRVVPGVANGTALTLANNTYCLREGDAILRGIKGLEGGTFSTEMIANACNNNMVYRPATITVLTNDEIRITGSTTAGTELLQTWKRVYSQQ